VDQLTLNWLNQSPMEGLGVTGDRFHQERLYPTLHKPEKQDPMRPISLTSVMASCMNWDSLGAAVQRVNAAALASGSQKKWSGSGDLLSLNLMDVWSEHAGTRYGGASAHVCSLCTHAGTHVEGAHHWSQSLHWCAPCVLET
jgi:hypothetical protein